MKVKKLKPKKGTKGSPDKFVVKEIPADSFLNFFSPPNVSEHAKDDEISDKDQALLAMDFDVGFAIKEKIIPRAIFYFTGEVFDDATLTIVKMKWMMKKTK